MNANGLFAQDTTKTVNPNKQGPHFVDKNGDGYNDNAPDHDGDGIPNGLDPDYQKAQKQKGKKKQKFIDLDGDGIDDNLMRSKQKHQHRVVDQNNQKSQGKPLDEQDRMKQKQRQKKGSGKQ